MQFDKFQKFSSPDTIMGFVLQLLHLVGLDGPGRASRIRLASVMLFYLTFIVIPELTGGYTDVHQFVRTGVELLFNCNIFVGGMLFALEVTSFRMFIRELKFLAMLASSLSYKLKHAMARFNYRANTFAKLQTLCMGVIALAYWVAPLPSIYWFYYHPDNATEPPVRLVQHLEVKFYWLENRTMLKDYVAFAVIMLPVVCMCSAVCNIKVMTISGSIAYCTLFTRLTANAIEQLPDVTPAGWNPKALSHVVSMHASLLKTIHLLDRTLRSVLLLQWLGCGLNWSISLVYLTNTGISFKSSTVCVMFLLATSETFLYCWLGSRLATQQERLERAIYAKRWYNYPRNERCSVLTILRQAQKPAVITVGKFFRVNLEEFSRIVNLSYSAYVVLKDQIKMDAILQVSISIGNPQEIRSSNKTQDCSVLTFHFILRISPVHSMVLPKLKDEKAVMPFLLRIQTIAGLWGDRSQRYRFYLIFSYFCLMVVLPKVLFGYPDLEIAVRGTAELMFESNAFFGMLMFSFQRDNYEKLVHQLQDLAALGEFCFVVLQNGVYPSLPSSTVLQDLPAELGQYLIAVNRRIDRSSKIYCCCHFSMATFFWFMPVWSTYSAYRAAATNSTEPVEHVLHLEEELYFLHIRTSLVHYTFYAAIMWPTIYTLGFTGGTKLLTIFSNVKYCSAMLKLVALRMQCLTGVKRERVEEELNEIISMHQRALDCVLLLETTFRWVFFVQFIQCTMIWCSLILYIAVTGFSSTVANVCVQIILVTVETYGYCYFGTDLTTESYGVALAVYDSDWYKFSVSMRRKLRLLLQRSQKPLGVTAGKFRFVNVAQFGKMLKMSYSFYVVLKEQF
ncbi:uncharacterized protein LOC118506317 [Anopheles stephensi]|uniref:uncharacterized protein LOC118506317 n=1 Tax=Anopheles stephensi TaxID=30069 RepID=UPI001658BF20|nr:uncharacterized protein LOC118506317 [Anopheles stephensi]